VGLGWTFLGGAALLRPPSPLSLDLAAEQECAHQILTWSRNGWRLGLLRGGLRWVAQAPCCEIRFGSRLNSTWTALFNSAAARFLAPMACLTAGGSAPAFPVMSVFDIVLPKLRSASTSRLNAADESWRSHFLPLKKAPDKIESQSLQQGADVRRPNSAIRSFSGHHKKKRPTLSSFLPGLRSSPLMVNIRTMLRRGAALPSPLVVITLLCSRAGGLTASRTAAWVAPACTNIVFFGRALPKDSVLDIRASRSQQEHRTRPVPRGMSGNLLRLHIDCHIEIHHQHRTLSIDTSGPLPLLLNFYLPLALC